MTQNEMLLTQKIQAYYQARASYDQAKKLSDDADQERRDKERDLVDYMIEHGLKKIELADGTTPLLVHQISFRCTKENAEDIRAWLIDTVGDDADFMERTLSRPALHEHLNRLITKDKIDPDDLPSFLEANSQPGLRVLGWKGRA